MNDCGRTIPSAEKYCCNGCKTWSYVKNYAPKKISLKEISLDWAHGFLWLSQRIVGWDAKACLMSLGVFFWFLGRLIIFILIKATTFPFQATHLIRDTSFLFHLFVGSFPWSLSALSLVILLSYFSLSFARISLSSVKKCMWQSTESFGYAEIQLTCTCAAHFKVHAFCSKTRTWAKGKKSKIRICKQSYWTHWKQLKALKRLEKWYEKGKESWIELCYVGRLFSKMKYIIVCVSAIENKAKERLNRTVFIPLNIIQTCHLLQLMLLLLEVDPEFDSLLRHFIFITVFIRL